MTLLTIVRKNLRQRLLATALTSASVALGVALIVAIHVIREEAQKSLRAGTAGYQVVVGAKGSATQLVLNTVFHLDQSPGTIPYAYYWQLKHDPKVEWAVPYAVGDNYYGFRCVATEPEFFTVFRYGEEEDRRLRFADPAKDRACEREFEAVLGAEVARRVGLSRGDEIVVTHGVLSGGHLHAEHPWRVVGVLAPTGTAIDRVVYTTFQTQYGMAGHNRRVRTRADRLEERFARLGGGFDLVVAAKEVRPLDALLRLIYQEGPELPSIPYSLYHELRRDERVRALMPVALTLRVEANGQSVPVAAVHPSFLTSFPYSVTLSSAHYGLNLDERDADGAPRPAEFVSPKHLFLGSAAARRLGLSKGDQAVLWEGQAGRGRQFGDDSMFRVGGLLAPTNTPWDDCAFMHLADYHALPYLDELFSPPTLLPDMNRVADYKRDLYARLAPFTVGYNLVVGAPGESEGLVLARAVFRSLRLKVEDRVSYAFYEQIRGFKEVAAAVPLEINNRFRGFPVVATTAEYLTTFPVTLKERRPVTLSVTPAGAAFAWTPGRREAVLGAEVARRAGVATGAQIVLTPGVAGERADLIQFPFTVVGVLEPVKTPDEGCVFISLESQFSLPRDDGTPLPAEERALTAVLVRVPSPQATGRIMALINSSGQGRAVSPTEAAGRTVDRLSALERAAFSSADRGLPADRPISAILVKATTTPVPADAARAAGAVTARESLLAMLNERPGVRAFEPGAALASLYDEQDRIERRVYARTADLALPPEMAWYTDKEVSAVILKVRDEKRALSAAMLRKEVNDTPFAQAVTPLNEMERIFGVLRQVNWLLSAIAAIVVAVAGASITIALYNSLSERRRDLAIMRAVGASRAQVAAPILLESLAITLGGGLCGLAAAALLSLAADAWLMREYYVRIDVWNSVAAAPGLLAGLFGALAMLGALAGLLPAWKAYETDVAANLAPLS
ncbi:MAG: ABC transporter permease [Planctomycetes bacterium]|nr:ABC transporter permease [Planctomycetota bacterium]